MAVDRNFIPHRFLIREYPQVQLLPIGSIEEGITALLEKKADYYLCTKRMCDAYIEQSFISNISDRGGLNIPQLDKLNVGHIAVRNDLTILQSILNKAIESIGQTEKSLLADKWLSTNAIIFQPKPLSSAEKDWLEKHKRIAFSKARSVPPLNYIDNDGLSAGVTEDILQRFQEMFGVETHLKEFETFRGSLSAVIDGEVELIPGLNISPQRQKQLLFTKPFIKYNLALYTHADNPFIDSLEAMDGKRLAVMNAGAMASRLEKSHPEIELVRYRTIESLVQAVANKQVDALISNPYFVDYVVKSEGFDSIVYSGDTVYEFEYAMAVHPSNPELVSLLNRTLETIDDQQISLMVDKWMNVRLVKDTTWLSVSIFGGVASLLLIIGILFTYYRLHRKALADLATTQQKLTHAQRVTNIGSWDLDSDYARVSLSEQAAEILGVAKGKVLSKVEFVKLVNAEDKQAYLAKWLSAPDTGLVNIEYRLGDDDPRWVNEKAELEFDDKGDFIGGSGTIQEISEFKDVEQKLLVQQQELRALTSQLLTVQEEERKRVARELHDDLTQRLALLSIDLGGLRNSLTESTDVECLNKVKRDIVEIAEDTHSLSRRLHPSIIDDLGLIEALRSEIDNYQRREEIKVDFFATMTHLDLTKDEELVIFRIVQEALRNVSKYSEASQVRINLASIQQFLILQIQDDGMGFDVDEALKSPGLGLKSMLERARLVNGELTIRSQENKGVSIELEIPINAPSNH
ncbi:sensor histidine kinase [Vibrio maritimus]|uniref:histidine kinase n=1 Tax=Vibrio maritimus TaxID=990268 RepID=A0A090TQ27_9VIBR|nr:sensor histidine kinase [Vibrio maritimus]